MQLYDIHAHLADPRIGDDVSVWIRQAEAAGVAGILANAARRREWDAILRLAASPAVYAALGIHPFYVAEWHPGMVAELRHKAANHAQVKAIGEIGLDGYRSRGDIEAQVPVLVEQLELAVALDLPVVVHNRKSWNEFFQVLKELRLSTLRGVCHAFSGSRELARQVLDRGLMISFAGPLTNDNAARLREVSAYIPVDRLLTETDCPDLPAQGIRPDLSRPQHVRLVLETLAAARKQPVGTLAGHIENNFRRLLRLG